jgi:RHS repeat-associated protein
VRETLAGLEVIASFDGVGNELGLTYPGGRAISWVHDELDRISSITEGAVTLAEYSYTGPGRVARRDFGNGTRWGLEYSGLGNAPGDFGDRVVRRSAHSVIAGGAIVDDRSFTWDPNGNKASMTDERTSQARVFAYDSLDRLIASTGGPAGTVAYAFDGVGNRTEVTGGADAGLYDLDPATPEPADAQMNQYTATPIEGMAAAPRDHDRNGNVTLLPYRDDMASTTVMAGATYDYRNQMVRYERPDLTAEYRYDALGRRIAQTLTDNSDSTTTLFFYRGDRVIEERDGGGAVQATYVYGNAIDEILSMRRSSSGAGGGGGGGPPVETDYFYHSDDQGTIWAVTDDTGAVVERYDYEDYGRSYALDASGVPLPDGAGAAGRSAIGNRYRFTGREFDEETGLYWYRTRYYDPRAGRFTSRDTIGIWGDPANLGNGQAYVGNNPWTFVDPHGLFVGTGARKFLEKLGDIVDRVEQTIADLIEPVIGYVYDRILGPTVGMISRIRQREDNMLSRGLPTPEGAEQRAAAARAVVVTGVAVAAAVVTTEVVCRVLPGRPSRAPRPSAPRPAAPRTPGPSAARGAARAVGQEHHAISRTVHRALERHPNLAGQYTARDPRFVTRAVDDAAHRGYQRWHRQLDSEVADWIGDNPRATPSQFESYLRNLYSRSDLASRFPNGF